MLCPTDRDELMEMVLMVLQAKLGERPPVDDDGDVVLMHLDQPVWIRVRHEQPAIEIFARVAHDVRSRRATAVEVAVLNRDNPWVKWTQRGPHGLAAPHDSRCAVRAGPPRRHGRRVPRDDDQDA